MGNCFSSKKKVELDPASLEVELERTREPVDPPPVQHPVTNPKVGPNAVLA